MNNNYIEVKSPSEIDLDNNAVIEASAGTGKTYTIENLVIRIILEKKVQLNKILIVTYTEKATGEMKGRIRTKLLEKINTGIEHNSIPEQELELLKTSIENFDEASIFTIHGFCNRILKEFAFENKKPFEVELTDDKIIYKKVLTRFKRKNWYELFGDSFEYILSISKYSENTDSTILKLCEDYKQNSEIILPDISICESIAGSGNIIGHFREVCETLRKALGEIDNDAPSTSEIAVNYNSARKGKRKKESIDIVIFLLEIFSRYGQDDFFTTFQKIAEVINSTDYTIIRDNIEKADNNLDERITLIVDSLNRLELWKYYFIIKTVYEIKNAAREFKTEKSLISYDDMAPELLQNISSTDQNQSLISSIRKKYIYALVDEFQDTDSIQWNIFKKIFLDSEQEHKLIIIGDPKQAIYAFRGADVFAYFEAKNYMLEILKANLYILKTNWRSLPGLLDGLNHIFNNAWFSNPGIQYLPVNSPEKPGANIISDSSGRAPVTVVSLSQKIETASSAGNEYSRFIADECRFLLSDSSVVIAVKDKKGKFIERNLRADDICILVRKAENAQSIEKELKKYSLPVSYYKKQGLYQSIEALNLLITLKTLAYPEKQSYCKSAMLTEFFSFDINEVCFNPEILDIPGIRNLLSNWRSLAIKRKWSYLFSSMLEDSGLIFNKSQEYLYERSMTNYRHIMQNLETEAYTGHLDIISVYELLNRYVTETLKSSEDSDLHKIETEQPKIKIMTIHASKGLEFPIVFAAGGLTARSNHQYYKYHNERGDVCYDLANSNKEIFKLEELREDEQLFYVAMTRAVYKLYLLAFTPKRNAQSGFGIHSLAPRLNNAVASGNKNISITSYPDEKKTKDGNFSNSPVFKENNISKISKNETEKKYININCYEQGSIDSDKINEILDESYEKYYHRKKIITSFTGLKYIKENYSREYTRPDSSSSGENEYRFEDEKNSPAQEYEKNLLQIKNADNFNKNMDFLLPAGKTIGTILHRILEIIDYSATAKFNSYNEIIESETFSELIRKILRENSIIEFEYEKSGAKKNEFYLSEISKIIFNALHTPILNDFRLCLLNNSDRLTESEFYFPIRNKIAGGCQKYINGSIDLIFRNNGKYYFADWKSTRLSTDYSKENIKNDIVSEHYTLQYKIYSIAVIRWLAVNIADFNYSRDFGGIFYFYLRGMNGCDNKSGIYFERQENLSDIINYENDIANFLERR